MAVFDGNKGMFIESYREIRHIQKRSEDYFRDPSFGAKLDANDVKIVSAEITKIFNELTPIITKLGESSST